MKTSNLIKLTQLANQLRMGGYLDVKKPEPYNFAYDPINQIHGLIDLVEVMGGLKDKVVVEVGCFLGVSTETFLLHEPKQLFAVDVWGKNPEYEEAEKFNKINDMDWKDVEESFKLRVEKYSNVEVIKNYSVEASKGFQDESLDFVYVDGDHSDKGVSDDICSWYPKVKRGGHIAGHDFYSHLTGENRPLVGVESMVLGLLDPFSIGFPSSHVIPAPDADNHVSAFSDSSWLFKKL